MISPAISSAIPDALVRHNYQDTDEVILITFETSSQHVLNPKTGTLTVKDLRGLNLPSAGSTCMSKSIPLFRDAVNSYQMSDRFHVTVISDGEVDHSDRSVTRDLALSEQRVIRSSAIISGALLRFMSSAGASPDTTAMASLANFINVQGASVPIVDVSNDGNATKNIEDAIVAGMVSSGVGSSLLIESVPGSTFKLSPTDEPCNKLKIGAGSRVLILMSNCPEKLIIGGVEYVKLV